MHWLWQPWQMLGIKVFVLILLYILAMHWYHLYAVDNAVRSNKNKLKGLLIAMFNEPINMVIIIAMVLLGFGINLSTFPAFLENTILRMSVMMTPLVLLFIGLAVRVKWHELKLIFFLLTWRAGITFCLSALFIYFMPELSVSMALLAVVFPQSSCSFWPFAHMSTVHTMEETSKPESPTFNINFALSVLACSLPFSTTLILGVFSFTEFFMHPLHLVITGMVLTLVSCVPFLLKKLKATRSGKPGLGDLTMLSGFTEEIEPERAS